MFWVKTTCNTYFFEVMGPKGPLWLFSIQIKNFRPVPSVDTMSKSTGLWVHCSICKTLASQLASNSLNITSCGRMVCDSCRPRYLKKQQVPLYSYSKGNIFPKVAKHALCSLQRTMPNNTSEQQGPCYCVENVQGCLRAVQESD